MTIKLYNEGEHSTFKSASVWYFVLYVPYKIAQLVYLKSHKFGESNFYRLMDFVELQRKIKNV
jgi:hypothetical protein